MIQALKAMKNGKAEGPDGIPTESRKALCEEGIVLLVKLLKEI